MQNRFLFITSIVVVLLAVSATGKKKLHFEKEKQFCNFKLFVTGAEENDPCCSFPCQNDGICISKGNSRDFTCDCTGLDYYGKTCETRK